MRAEQSGALLLLTGLRIGSACALCGTLLFYLLTAASLYLPTERVLLNLRLDAKAGVFVEQPGYLIDRKIHADPFTDCTILLMAIHRGNSVLESTISPSHLQKIGDGSPCTALSQFLGGVDPDTLASSTYHRYIHGHTTLTRLLLFAMGYQLSLSAIGIVTLVSGLLMLAAALLRLSREIARNTWQDGKGLPLLAYSAVLFIYLGWGSFSASFSHAPWVIVTFWLVTLASMDRHQRWFNERLAIVCGGFGTVMAILEFLNGPIPFGLATLIVLLAILVPSTCMARELTRRIMLGGSSYCAAIGVAYASKLGLAVLVFGSDVLRDFSAQLSRRMSGGDAGLKGVYWALEQQLDRIGFISNAAGASVLALAGAVILGTLAGTMIDRRLRRRAPRLLAGLAAVLLVAAWYAAFRQHTAEHAFFMFRLLVIPVAVAATMMAWVAMALREQSACSTC